MLLPRLRKFYNFVNYETGDDASKSDGDEESMDRPGASHKHNQLEIIYISSDLTEDDFRAAIETMPWYSTLYDEDRAVMIANKFEVTQIPWLLILRDGKVYM